MKKGFTLIELLIVVAIIAILAAIAVPNFLEAQTRAKIARVHADLRTVATAIESYTVDHGVPPLSHFPNGGWWVEPAPARFYPLTTPVSYITSSLSIVSPFKDPNEINEWWNYYQYSTAIGLSLWPAGIASGEVDAYLNGWYRLAAGKQKAVGQGLPFETEGPQWMILDRGPDKTFFYVHANFGGGGDYTWDESIVYYDPTNGTVSPGEIGRWQGGSSAK